MGWCDHPAHVGVASSCQSNYGNILNIHLLPPYGDGAWAWTYTPRTRTHGLARRIDQTGQAYAWKIEPLRPDCYGHLRSATRFRHNRLLPITVYCVQVVLQIINDFHRLVGPFFRVKSHYRISIIPSMGALSTG